jgi:hypothetical protein
MLKRQGNVKQESDAILLPSVIEYASLTDYRRGLRRLSHAALACRVSLRLEAEENMWI